MSTKQNEMPSTEIATISPMAQEMIENLGIVLANPDELTLRITMRLAMAETPDALDAIGHETAWENYLGVPFHIRNLFYLPATFDVPLGIYVLAEAANADTGEFTVLTTSATGVVVGLARAHQKGWLDRPWKVMQAEKPTSNGFYPLRLVQA